MISIAGITFTLSQCGVSACARAFGSADVVNAASLEPGVSPGSLVTILGYGFTKAAAGNEAPTVAVANGYPLPMTWNGTSVQMNGVAAPILAIDNARPDGRQQINVLAPYELASAQASRVVVSYNGVTSPLIPASLAAAQPGVFTDGTGIAVAQHPANGSLVAGSNPALPGEVILVCCTGLGPVKPQPVTGSLPASGILPATVTLPSVMIGGAAAQVVSSGLAADAAGVYLVAVRVPDGLTPGRAGVVVAIGAATSQHATISIGAR